MEAPVSPDEARRLLESEMATVEALIACVCRQKGLYGDEADSFASEVRFKLVADDYAVLRGYSARSSLRTYLTVVLANHYRDRRIRSCGKWRPSAVAKRSGPDAVLLDRYVNRDEMPAEQALHRVLSRADCTTEEPELRRILHALPRRQGRTFESLEGGTLSTDQTPVKHLEALEREALRTRVLAALDAALPAIPEEEQLIIRLRFHERLTVAQIARTLRLEQKPLYRRIEKTLATLRDQLIQRGVRREHLLELLT